MTDMKRLSISFDSDIIAALERIRVKPEFEQASTAQIVRFLVRRGVKSVETRDGIAAGQEAGPGA